MVEYDTKVSQFEELGHSKKPSISGRNEVNKGFQNRLRSHQEQYGGGACTQNYHHPVEGPVTLYLAAWEGENPSEGHTNTSTVTLDEGDTATIGVSGSEYRIKFFGQYMDRPESENILNKHTVAYAIDRWDDKEKLWRECEFYFGVSESGKWFDQQERITLRVAIKDAPGYDPERDFVDLITTGLSPAEAIDYWMTDIQNRPQQDWADTRGTTQQAISKNVQKARKKLDKTE